MLLYIELHKSLFPAESDAYGVFNRFFEKKHDAVQENIHGVSVYTLNYTEPLFCLICHAFKHFMGSGFGMRQVRDITLFANHYGKEIDWEIVLEQYKEIGADRLVVSIFWIGEKYLTFDSKQACYPEAFRELAVDEEDLLNDMFEGDVLGNKDLSRIHSSNITLNAVTANKKGKNPRGWCLR